MADIESDGPILQRGTGDTFFVYEKSHEYSFQLDPEPSLFTGIDLDSVQYLWQWVSGGCAAFCD